MATNTTVDGKKYDLYTSDVLKQSTDDITSQPPYISDVEPLIDSVTDMTIEMLFVDLKDTFPSVQNDYIERMVNILMVKSNLLMNTYQNLKRDPYEISDMEHLIDIGVTYYGKPHKTFLGANGNDNFHINKFLMQLYVDKYSWDSFFYFYRDTFFYRRSKKAKRDRIFSEEEALLKLMNIPNVDDILIDAFIPTQKEQLQKIQKECHRLYHVSPTKWSFHRLTKYINATINIFTLFINDDIFTTLLIFNITQWSQSYLEAYIDQTTDNIVLYIFYNSQIKIQADIILSTCFHQLFHAYHLYLTDRCILSGPNIDHQPSQKLLLHGMYFYRLQYTFLHVTRLPITIDMCTTDIYKMWIQRRPIIPFNLRRSIYTDLTDKHMVWTDDKNEPLLDFDIVKQQQLTSVVPFSTDGYFTEQSDAEMEFYLPIVSFADLIRSPEYAQVMRDLRDGFPDSDIHILQFIAHTVLSLVGIKKTPIFKNMMYGVLPLRGGVYITYHDLISKNSDGYLPSDFTRLYRAVKKHGRIWEQLFDVSVYCNYQQLYNKITHPLELNYIEWMKRGDDDIIFEYISDKVMNRNEKLIQELLEDYSAITNILVFIEKAVQLINKIIFNNKWPSNRVKIIFGRKNMPSSTIALTHEGAISIKNKKVWSMGDLFVTLLHEMIHFYMSEIGGYGLYNEPHAFLFYKYCAKAYYILNKTLQIYAGEMTVYRKLDWQRPLKSDDTLTFIL